MNSTEQNILDTFGLESPSHADESAALDADSALLDRYFNEGELSPALIATMQQLAARPLEELFRYCFEGRLMDTQGLQRAARRFVAVAWLLHSEMMTDEAGKVLTLEQLSKLPQLDCTRCALSILAGDFGKRFNFHARVQKRQGSKANYAASAKKGWDRRGRLTREQLKRRPGRSCRRCIQPKTPADFQPGKQVCNSCLAISEDKICPKPDRACSRCHVTKPADQFDPRMRVCRSCRSPEPPIGLTG